MNNINPATLNVLLDMDPAKLSNYLDIALIGATILIFVILVLCFLRGLLRGWKKGTYHLIFMAILFITAIFTLDVATQAAMNFNISFALQEIKFTVQDKELVIPVTTAGETARNAIYTILKDGFQIQADPTVLYNYSVAMATSFIKLVLIFVEALIILIIGNLLALFLWHILFKWFLPYPIRKRHNLRWVSGIQSVLVAIVTMTLMIAPLSSVVNTVSNNLDFDTTSLNTNENKMLALADNLLTTYQNSLFSKVFFSWAKPDGKNTLDYMLMDSLIQSKVGETTVSGLREIASLSSIAGNAAELYFGNSFDDGIAWKSLLTSTDQVTEIIAELGKTSLFQVVVPFAVKVAAQLDEVVKVIGDDAAAYVRDTDVDWQKELDIVTDLYISAVESGGFDFVSDEHSQMPVLLFDDPYAIIFNDQFHDSLDDISQDMDKMALFNRLATGALYTLVTSKEEMQKDDDPGTLQLIDLLPIKDDGTIDLEKFVETKWGEEIMTLVDPLYTIHDGNPDAVKVIFNRVFEKVAPKSDESSAEPTETDEEWRDGLIQDILYLVSDSSDDIIEAFVGQRDAQHNPIVDDKGKSQTEDSCILDSAFLINAYPSIPDFLAASAKKIQNMEEVDIDMSKSKEALFADTTEKGMRVSFKKEFGSILDVVGEVTQYPEGKELIRNYKEHPGVDIDLDGQFLGIAPNLARGFQAGFRRLDDSKLLKDLVPPIGKNFIENNEAIKNFGLERVYLDNVDFGDELAKLLDIVIRCPDVVRFGGTMSGNTSMDRIMSTLQDDDFADQLITSLDLIGACKLINPPEEHNRPIYNIINKFIANVDFITLEEEDFDIPNLFGTYDEDGKRLTNGETYYLINAVQTVAESGIVKTFTAGTTEVSETIRALTKVDLEELFGSIGGSSLLRKAVVTSLDDKVIEQMLKPSEVNVENLSFKNLNVGTEEEIRQAWQREGKALNAIVALADRGVDFTNIDLFGGQGNNLIQILKKFADSGIFKYTDTSNNVHYLFNQYFCNKLIVSLKGSELKYFCDQYRRPDVTTLPESATLEQRSVYLTTFINNCMALDKPSDWADDGAQLDIFGALLNKIGELGGIDGLSQISTDNIQQLRETLRIVVDSDVAGNVVVPNAIEDAIDNIEAEDFEFDNANTPYLWSLNVIADKEEAKHERLVEVSHIMEVMGVLFDSHYGIYQGGTLDMSRMNVYSISTEYFMRPVLAHSRQSHVLYEPKDPAKLSVFQLTMATFVKHSGIYGDKVTTIDQWISTPAFESNKYCDYSIRELVERIPMLEWDQEIENLCELIDRAKETIFIDPIEQMIDFSAISDPKTFFNSDVTGKNEQDLRDLVRLLNKSELFYRSLPYHLATSFENIDVLGGDFVADIGYANPYFGVYVDTNGRRDQNRLADADIENLLDVLKIFGSKASGINMTDITNIDAGGVGDLLEAMGNCAVFNKYNDISSPTKTISNPAQAHKQGLTSFQAVMVDFLCTDALQEYYYSTNSPKDRAMPYDSLKTKAVYEVQRLLPTMGLGYGPEQNALINGQTNSLRAVLKSLTSSELSSIVSNTGFEVGKLNYETFMLLLGELNNCPLTQDIVPNAISSMVTGSGAYAPNIDGVKFDRGNYYFSYWWYGNPITYHAQPDYTQKFYVPELEQMASICSFLSDNKSAVDDLATFEISKIDPYLMRDMLAELNASYCFHLAGVEDLPDRTYEVNDALRIRKVDGFYYYESPITVFEQLMFKFYVDSGLAKEAFDPSYDIRHLLACWDVENAAKVKVYENMYLFSYYSSYSGKFSHIGDWLTEIEALTTDGRRHNGYDLDDSDVGLLETVKTLNSIMGGDKVNLDVNKFRKLSPAQIRWVLQGLNRVDIISDALAKSARSLITTNDDGDGLGIQKYTAETEKYALSPSVHEWTLPNDGYFLDDMQVANMSIRFKFVGDATQHFRLFEDFGYGWEEITSVTNAGEDLTPDAFGYYAIDIRRVPGIFKIIPNDSTGVFEEIEYTYDTANFRQSQSSFATTDINTIYYFLASAYRGVNNGANPDNLYFSFDEGKGITEFLNEDAPTTFYKHSTYGLMNFFLTSNIYAQTYDDSGKLTEDEAQTSYTAGDYALYNLFQVEVEFNGAHQTVSIADNFGDGDRLDHLKYLNKQRNTYYSSELTVEHSLLESAFLDNYIIGAGTLQAYVDASKIALGPTTPAKDMGILITDYALGSSQNDVVQSYLDKAMTDVYHNAVNGHYDPSISGCPEKFSISLDDEAVRMHLTGSTDPITEPGYIGKSILAGQMKSMQEISIASIEIPNVERFTAGSVAMKSPTQPDVERVDAVPAYSVIDPYNYDNVTDRYTFSTLKDNVETVSIKNRILAKLFAGMGNPSVPTALTAAQKTDFAALLTDPTLDLDHLSGDRKSVMDTFYLGNMYNALIYRLVFYKTDTYNPAIMDYVHVRNDIFDMVNATNFITDNPVDMMNANPYTGNVAFSYANVAQAILNSAF